MNSVFNFGAVSHFKDLWVALQKAHKNFERMRKWQKKRGVQDSKVVFPEDHEGVRNAVEALQQSILSHKNFNPWRPAAQEYLIDNPYPLLGFIQGPLTPDGQDIEWQIPIHAEFDCVPLNLIRYVWLCWDDLADAERERAIEVLAGWRASVTPGWCIRSGGRAPALHQMNSMMMAVNSVTLKTPPPEGPERPSPARPPLPDPSRTFLSDLSSMTTAPARQMTEEERAENWARIRAFEEDRWAKKCGVMLPEHPPEWCIATIRKDDDDAWLWVAEHMMQEFTANLVRGWCRKFAYSTVTAFIVECVKEEEVSARQTDYLEEKTNLDGSRYEVPEPPDNLERWAATERLSQSERARAMSESSKAREMLDRLTDEEERLWRLKNVEGLSRAEIVALTGKTLRVVDEQLGSAYARLSGKKKPRKHPRKKQF